MVIGQDNSWAIQWLGNMVVGWCNNWAPWWLGNMVVGQYNNWAIQCLKNIVLAVHLLPSKHWQKRQLAIFIGACGGGDLSFLFKTVPTEAGSFFRQTTSE